MDDAKEYEELRAAEHELAAARTRTEEARTRRLTAAQTREERTLALAHAKDAKTRAAKDAWRVANDDEVLAVAELSSAEAAERAALDAVERAQTAVAEAEGAARASAKLAGIERIVGIQEEIARHLAKVKALRTEQETILASEVVPNQPHWQRRMPPPYEVPPAGVYETIGDVLEAHAGIRQQNPLGPLVDFFQQHA